MDAVRPEQAAKDAVQSLSAAEGPLTLAPSPIPASRGTGERVPEACLARNENRGVCPSRRAGAAGTLVRRRLL